MSNKINIPETVTLVLKKTRWYTLPKAYIAIDKSSLESGLRWAENRDYPSESITIKNGSIKSIVIEDSACGSSQGGKLSFWTCILTLPDDRECSIGINADNLCEFIKANTFINGKCEVNIYLGRQNSQQAVFTENMDSYKDGIDKRQLKTVKQSSNYNIGDIVQSMTQNQVYIGKIYQYLDLYIRRNYSYSSHSYVIDYIVVWNKNPEAQHWLPSIDLDTLEPSIFIYDGQCYNKKPKRIITGNSLSSQEVNQAFNNAVNRYEENISDPNAFVPDLRSWLYNYMFTREILDDIDTELFKSAIKGKIIRYEKYMEKSGEYKVGDIFFYLSDDPRLKEKIRDNFIPFS